MRNLAIPCPLLRNIRGAGEVVSFVAEGWAESGDCGGVCNSEGVHGE